MHICLMVSIFYFSHTMTSNFLSIKITVVGSDWICHFSCLFSESRSSKNYDQLWCIWLLILFRYNFISYRSRLAFSRLSIDSYFATRTLMMRSRSSASVSSSRPLFMSVTAVSCILCNLGLAFLKFSRTV